MPKNDGVLEYFKRYGKFYLQGYDTCWRVEATDAISMPGILEITAVEYYANETTDDIENGIRYHSTSSCECTGTKTFEKIEKISPQQPYGR